VRARGLLWGVPVQAFFDACCCRFLTSLLLAVVSFPLGMVRSVSGVCRLRRFTTFYPCPPAAGSPNTTCALALLRSVEQANPSTESVRGFSDPGRVRSPDPSSCVFTELLSSLRWPFRSDSITVHTAFSTAPAGSSARARYFHSATNSLRARATIPTRRIRWLPEPNRRQNHCVNSLAG
jgi:hypothetical protein